MLGHTACTLNTRPCAGTGGERGNGGPSGRDGRRHGAAVTLGSSRRVFRQRGRTAPVPHQPPGRPGLQAGGVAGRHGGKAGRGPPAARPCPRRRRRRRACAVRGRSGAGRARCGGRGAAIAAVPVVASSPPPCP